MSDGGLSNILGFLYEALVFNSLLLDPWSAGPALSPDQTIGASGSTPSKLSERIRELLGSAVNLQGQQCDVDLLASSDQALVLIQMKASLSATADFTPAALRDCLIAEAKHIAQLQSNGESREIKKFILLTNRKPSPTLASTFEKYKMDVNEATAWIMDGIPGTASVGICLDLLQKFELLHLSIKSIQDHCVESLRTLGLMDWEINDFCTRVRGELISLQAPTVTALTDKMKASVFSSGFHTLCPERIKELLEVELGGSWEGAGLTNPVELSPLPRLRDQKSLIEAFEQAEQESGSVGVMVLGKGGRGKTHLLRNCLSTWSQNRICCLAPASKEADVLLQTAFDMVFRNYQFDRTVGLCLDRLDRASVACVGVDTPIWLFLPESDRLSPTECETLLLNLTAVIRNRPKVKLALTSRKTTFDNLNGKFNLTSVEVDLLDEDEVNDWKSRQGIPELSGQPLHDTFIRYPLVFDSLLNWSRESSNDLALFLKGDPSSRSSFWSFTRERLCRRIAKHITEDISTLSILFCEVFEKCRQGNAIADFNQLPSAKEIQTREAVVRRQFVELGILEVKNHHHYWSLEGYSQ